MNAPLKVLINWLVAAECLRVITVFDYFICKKSENFNLCQMTCKKWGFLIELLLVYLSGLGI